MKTIKFISLAAAAISLTACQETSKSEQGITIGNVFISKAKPVQGDLVELTFNSDEEIDNIILHYSAGKKNYMQDLEVQTSGQEIRTSFTVPDSATSMAFDFMKGSAAMNEASSMPVYSGSGEPLPGAYTGQALYYTDMGKAFGHEMATDSILNLFRKDLSAHPELKEAHELSYAAMLTKAKKEEGQEILKRIENGIRAKGDLTQQDLEKLAEVYRAMNNRAKADSLYQVMAEKFPNSDPAVIKKFNEIQQMTDLEEKEAATKAYAAQHPEHKSTPYLFSSLAQSLGRDGNYEKFEAVITEISDPQSKGRSLNSVAWKLAEEGQDMDRAAQYSKQSMEVIEQAMKAPEWDPAMTTKKLTQTQLEFALNMYRDTYALIQYKQGNLKEAVAYQGMAAGPDAFGEVNENYVKYLVEDQQFELAQEKASEYIRHNASTPKMKEYLETAFVSLNKEGSFADLLASLETEARENMKKEILKEMINKEAKGFTLKNIKGGEVSLADLRGKTVVLDFWATWCGPCIASFPGMQQAQNKYAEDENVVFLFIDTFERGTDEKRIELTGDFIEKNEYSFTVLLDSMDEETKSFEVADNFGVTGIPAKFIIGPDGKIKFKSVGWNGSAEQLVTELDMMIELARM